MRIYEVLGSVSAAVSLQSAIHAFKSFRIIVGYSSTKRPSRSMLPRRILVDEIGRLSSAMIKSIGSMISGFSLLALRLEFISYAVLSVRRLTTMA